MSATRCPAAQARAGDGSVTSIAAAPRRAWDYLFPGEDRPLLLNHVEDRDLWRFKLAGTREIQAFIFSHEYRFDQWDRLMAANPTELLKMAVVGAAIERKHHKDVAELVKVCQRRLLIGATRCPLRACPTRW